MNELKEILKDKPFAYDQKQIVKNKEYITTLKPQPGQKVYELNLKTGTITEASYKKAFLKTIPVKDLFFPDTIKGFTTKLIKEIDFKPGFLYCVAINEATAIKKFIKVLRPANV